jgi:hypothetical protein
MSINGYRPLDAPVCRAAFPDLQFTPLGQGLAPANQQTGKP